jgi:hypothetical protein
MSQQPPLFGMPEPKPEYPQRAEDMWRVWGKADGRTCRHCTHLERYEQGTRWLKCGLSTKTSSSATDWRAGWPACGKFEDEQ